MIQSCRCGPAIDVLHTHSGFVFARLFRSFYEQSDDWVDRGDGKMRRQVHLECDRCDSSLEYEETRAAVCPPSHVAGVLSRVGERLRALLAHF